MNSNMQLKFITFQRQWVSQPSDEIFAYMLHAYEVTNDIMLIASNLLLMQIVICRFRCWILLNVIL